MKISIEALRAVGVAPEMILAALQADQVAAAEKRRSDTRERVRRHRSSNAGNESNALHDDVTPVTQETRFVAEHIETKEISAPVDQDRDSKKESLQGSKVRKRSKRGLSSEPFERFWAVRARREGSDPRDPCEKMFAALVKSGEDPEEIISGTAGHADAMRANGKFGTPYVPQTIKFLKQRQYRDYLVKPETGPPPPDPSAKIGASGMTMDELRAFYAKRMQNGHGDEGLPREGNGVYSAAKKGICPGEKDNGLGGVGGLFSDDDREASLGDDERSEGLHEGGYRPH